MRAYPGLLIGLLAVCAAPLSAQDPAWVAQYHAAQAERPAALSSQARIAPAGEPGRPLLVEGRVYRPDGKTPAAGVTVFAYQTDAEGLYHRAGERGWRLKGWVVTDAEGGFRLETIRPASYPDSTVPQHIHLTLEGPHVPRQWTEEVRFADDPLVSKAASERATRDKWSNVRPVEEANGFDRIDLFLRSKAKADF